MAKSLDPHMPLRTEGEDTVEQRKENAATEMPVWGKVGGKINGKRVLDSFLVDYSTEKRPYLKYVVVITE